MTHNSDDEDEKSLFLKHMQGVTPLKKGTKIPHFTERPHVLQKKPLLKKESPRPEIFLSNPYTLEVQADTFLSYHQPGLMIKRLKALKTGDFRCEARLDLHGLHIDKAREVLSHFILTAFDRNLRHLLLIHGKGGQQGEVGILKSHVAHWLKQFPQVLAYVSATPKDGGTGALYLLLKRKV